MASPRPRRPIFGSSTPFFLQLLFMVTTRFITPTSSSSNGCLWKCAVVDNRTSEDDGACIFTPTSQSEVSSCDNTLTAISNVNEGQLPDGCRPGSTASLQVNKCNVYQASSVATGSCGSQQMSPGAMPLTNGNCIKVSSAALTGTQLNWATVQVYAIGLRNKVM